MLRLSATLLLLAVCAIFLAKERGQAQDKQLQREINRAIESGVGFLRERFDRETGVLTGHHPDGMTALAAWTLLESGVKADDPLIQKAADHLRDQCLFWSSCYYASLAILFFDKLGDPGDQILIEALTVRLLAGQTRWGGWVYDYPVLENTERDRLLALVNRTRQARIKTGARPQTDKKEQDNKARAKKELTPETLRQMAGLRVIEDQIGDNSNSHFAMLALWVARRHGFEDQPELKNALKRVDARFRQTQQKSGGWSYQFTQEDLTGRKATDDLSRVSPAMTCVGLIGLALGNAAQAKGKAANLTDDEAAKRGLEIASLTIGHPTGDSTKAHKFPEGAGNSYYFLWALERMAVLYGLKTLDGKDWYSWGAEILVANQDNTGNWSNGAFNYGADACFALLFLKKVNVTADLQVRIKDVVIKAPRELDFQLPIPIAREGAQSRKEVDPPKKVTAPKEPPPAKDPKVIPKKAPDPAPDVRLAAVRLTTGLLEKPAAEHDAILEKIRKADGAPYTQVLASTIPALQGATQAKARTTLAQRLAELAAADLRKEMKAIDPEIRAAAARAAALAKLKNSVDDLIDLLEDPEPLVLQAAHQSLKQLTAQDFGPPPEATSAQIRRAIAEWRAWSKKQK
jgi:hypothetical protein